LWSIGLSRKNFLTISWDNLCWRCPERACEWIGQPICDCLSVGQFIKEAHLTRQFGDGILWISPLLENNIRHILTHKLTLQIIPVTESRNISFLYASPLNTTQSSEEHSWLVVRRSQAQITIWIQALNLISPFWQTQ
jgi:hypothetical protein